MTEEQRKYLLKGINICSAYMSMLEYEDLVDGLSLQDIKIFDKHDLVQAYECGHYDGLRDELGDFDTFYKNNFS